MYTHGITFGGHPGAGGDRAQEHRDHEARADRRARRASTQDAFRATLAQLLDLPIVGDLRGTGFFYALELVKDKETRETFSEEECETLLRGFLSPRLFERGLICRADDRGDPVVQISPPLVADAGASSTRSPASSATVLCGGVGADGGWLRSRPGRRGPAGSAVAPCARWCSTRPGGALRAAELPAPEPGPGPGARRASTRAASAAPTSTSSTASCPTRSCRSFPATRSSATSSSGAAARALRGGRPRRRPLARLDVRRVPLLPERPREPLRPRPLHRLPARRRLRRGRRRRRALLLPAPRGLPDLQAAPLLCAGLIGYRALRLAGDAERLGLYGFGAAAHIVAQVARHEGRRVFAFTRPGDEAAQALRARAGRRVGRRPLGAGRRRSSTRRSSSPRPASSSPPRSRAVAKGGTVVCAGIHMSDIPSFPYELLWGERVAPLGRQPDAPRRRGVPGARAAGCRCGRR